MPGLRSMASKRFALKPRWQIMFAKTPVPAPMSSTSLPSGGQNFRNVSTHTLGDANPSFSRESCSYASAHFSYASLTSSLGVRNRDAAIFWPSDVVSSAILIAGELSDARDDARDEACDSPPMLPMDSTESEVWMWCVALCFAMAATAFSPVSGGICDTTSGVAPLARPKLDKTDPAAKSATALAPSALPAGPRSTCTFWRSRRSLILLDR